MLSPFHQEIFSFLRDQIDARLGAGEIPKSLHNALNEKSAAGFDEIIDDVKKAYDDRGIQLERRWIGSFSSEEFAKAGIPLYVPRIYRALPRLYLKDNPSRWMFKDPFTNLSLLRKSSIDRAVMSLYDGGQRRGVVVIFVWVIPDGFGDWIAALEAAKILRQQADVRILAVSARTLEVPNSVSCEIVEYEKDPSEVTFTPAQLQLLRDSDLILQIPTFFPKTEALLYEVSKRRASRPFPAVEHIGEYGYLESSWFHPKTGRRSMGLHALERGIFVKESLSSKWGEIQNRTFQAAFPIDQGQDAYSLQAHIHFAYLSTRLGGAIYFHALLKMWEKDAKQIDLCTPDLGWLIAALEKVEGMAEIGSFGIRKIEVWLEERIHPIEIQKEGKIVRIIHLKGLSSEDARRLMCLSEGWIGVRGDQSFSEVLATGKPFFYDGRDHAQYFMKDWMAIAQNRLISFPTALSIIRSNYEAYLWNLPEETSEWVEDTYFQRGEGQNWRALASAIGMQLRNPKTALGFQQLGKIIAQEHAFNPFLLQLLERVLHRRERPTLVQDEEKLLGLYGNGTISLEGLVKNLKVCMMRQ